VSPVLLVPPEPSVAPVVPVVPVPVPVGAGVVAWVPLISMVRSSA
jgi:hypothetical protein